MRESLSYLWVLSVCASLWWCYEAFVKKSFRINEIRYFEVDTVRKQLRIPRPMPTYVKTHEIVNIESIKRFFVEDLHSGENAGALNATVSSTGTSIPVEIRLLADMRFSHNDLLKIANWLTLLCDSCRRY